MFGDTNFIPLMPWEQHLAALGGVTVVVLRFGITLFASVVLHLLWRWVPTVQGRHLYALLTGAALVYYPFGNGCIHLIVPAMVVYAAMLLTRRHCRSIAWMVTFPYLIACHVMQASGTSWKEGVMDFTGAQMVITLRIIAIAVCYQDGGRSDEALRDYAKAKRLSTLPSPLEFFGYLFACGNLLCGPFYEYSDYSNYVARRASYTTPLSAPWLPGLARLAKSLFFMALYTRCSAEYAPQLLETARFFDLGIMQRVAMLMWVGFIYRTKYYFAWGMAESGLVFSGLCYNGQDSKGRPMWNKFINACIRNVEGCTSAALFATNWNVATGLWLRHYVYERLTPIGRKPTFFTLLATQLVSGFWHGVFSGYILFFSGLAFFFFSSRVVYRYESMAPSWVASFSPWMVVKWVYTMFTLNYLAIAFMVLTFEETMRVWKSMYFVGHIIMLAIVAAGWVLPTPKKKRTEGAGGAPALRKED